MNNTGINNKLAFLLGICILCMASCTSPYVTFTETYYISNEAEDTVRLLLEHPVVWDNNASENPQIVYYDSCCLTVSQGSTVRLHPGSIDSQPSALEAPATGSPAEGSYTWYNWKNLFTGTITTRIGRERVTLPYAYDHTFTISTNRIEGSIQ